MSASTFGTAAIVVALSVCATATAQAQTVTDPQACLALASDSARLNCYDAAFKYQKTIEQPSTATTGSQAVSDEGQAHAGIRQRTRELFSVDLGDAAHNPNAGRGSLLDSRWELAKNSKLGLFQMRAYKPVYLLPAFWTSDKNLTPQSPNPANTVNDPQILDSTELKFQLSFKTKVAENLVGGDNGDVWVGYTQSSRWQAYNGEDSRPFRETNYEPEVMLAFRNNYSLFGWHGRMTALHFNHQSNGRPDPLSRSWNRIILGVGLDREDWALIVRPWWRVPEKAKDDNNRDIEDYMGRGDATLIWHKNGHELALMGRHSLRSGRRAHGAVQLDYAFPLNRHLRGHVQVFDGYGESLIDYNHKATYVGLGVSLLEWF